MRQVSSRFMIREKFFLLFLFCVALLYAAGLNPFLPFGDSGHYYLLAQSLTQGKGYTFIAGPVPSPDTAYPFIYPVLLTPFVLAAPGNFFAPKVLTVFVTLFLIAAIYFCLPRIYRAKNASWVAFAYALSPFVAMYSRTMLTDIFFAFFALLAIFFVDRYAHAQKRAFLYLVCAAASFFLAFYTRSIGFTILGAAVCFFIARKQLKRGAVLCATFGCLMSFWLIRYMVLQLPSQYVNEALIGIRTPFDFMQRCFYNLAATVGKEIPDLFFYPFFAAVDPYEPVFLVKLCIGVALTAVVCVGFIMVIRRKGMGFAEWFCVVYGAVYISWAYHGSRLLLPVFPFFLYYAYTALRVTAGKRAVTGIFFVIIGIFCFGNSLTLLKERLQPFNPEEESFIAAADWMKTNIPLTSIVVSKNSRWLFVYSGGLRGAGLLRDRDIRRQDAYVQKSSADFIVIDQTKIFRDDARDYLMPLVQAYPRRYALVYASAREPVTRVYRVDR